MNDRLECAMLGANPDPLQWGWIGSEFSTLAHCQEVEQTFAASHQGGLESANRTAASGPASNGHSAGDAI